MQGLPTNGLALAAGKFDQRGHQFLMIGSDPSERLDRGQPDLLVPVLKHLGEWIDRGLVPDLANHLQAPLAAGKPVRRG